MCGRNGLFHSASTGSCSLAASRWSPRTGCCEEVDRATPWCRDWRCRWSAPSGGPSARVAASGSSRRPDSPISSAFRRPWPTELAWNSPLCSDVDIDAPVKSYTIYLLTCAQICVDLSLNMVVSELVGSNCFRLHPTSMIYKHSTIPVHGSLQGA